MGKIKLFITLNTLFIAVAQALAQGPNGTGTYYQNADGTKGRALKTALSEIIKVHEELGYGSLWEAFMTTDRRDDGFVWDMYSGVTDYEFVTSGTNYKAEGDCYNREHSMPKSWFDDERPMYTDLVHLIPTDGYVNGRRSNYPFGETDSPTYTSAGGFSKLGCFFSDLVQGSCNVVPVKSRIRCFFLPVQWSRERRRGLFGGCRSRRTVLPLHP